MILLINPPSPFLIDQAVMPPLGLLYLGTAINCAGRDQLCIVDLATDSAYPRDTCGTPSIIGITSTTPQFGSVLGALPNLRESFPDVPIAIGGPHATSDPESCTDFDYIVRGEGERAIVDWRNWDGQVVQYPTINNINSIPYPRRNLIDISKYHYTINDEPATTIMSSRGCPMHCAFCSHTWGSKVRLHSPEYIQGEIQYLKSIGYSALMFFDDIFTMNRSRITSITDMIKDEHIIYRCFVRSDTTDRKLLTMLYESGCVEVGFGAESGSQKILDIVHKNTTVEQNTKLVELAREIGIRTKAFLMVGLPGEDGESCQATYDWIRDTHPDSWDICIYQPYKGADITSNPEAYDIHIDNAKYEDSYYKGRSGEYRCSVSTSGLASDEIVAWRERISTELGGLRYNDPEGVGHPEGMSNDTE